MRPPANLFYSQHQSEHIPQKGKYAPVPEFSLMAMAATTATARVFVLAAATAAFATAFATTAATTATAFAAHHVDNSLDFFHRRIT